MVKQLVLIVPDNVYSELEKVSHKTGIRIQDLLLRSIVKVIDEFSGE